MRVSNFFKKIFRVKPNLQVEAGAGQMTLYGVNASRQFNCRLYKKNNSYKIEYYETAQDFRERRGGKWL